MFDAIIGDNFVIHFRYSKNIAKSNVTKILQKYYKIVKNSLTFYEKMYKIL